MERDQSSRGRLPIRVRNPCSPRCLPSPGVLKTRKGSAKSAAFSKLRTRARKNCEHAAVQQRRYLPPGLPNPRTRGRRRQPSADQGRRRTFRARCCTQSTERLGRGRSRGRGRYRPSGGSCLPSWSPHRSGTASLLIPQRRLRPRCLSRTCGPACAAGRVGSSRGRLDAWPGRLYCADGWFRGLAGSTRWRPCDGVPDQRRSVPCVPRCRWPVGRYRTTSEDRPSHPREPQRLHRTADRQTTWVLAGSDGLPVVVVVVLLPAAQRRVRSACAFDYPVRHCRSPRIRPQ